MINVYLEYIPNYLNQNSVNMNSKFSLVTLVIMLMLAFQSNAAFTGISSEVHAVNGIPGYTTYRIYADFDDVGDQLVQVFGLDIDPLFITSTGDIYQNAAGGGLSSDISSGLFPFVPELIYDSWLTIGAEDNTTSGLIALEIGRASCRERVFLRV